MDTLIATMINEAHQALTHSYAPYSKFCVASCIATDKGNLYTGVNVENRAYSVAVCAETSAIAKMISAGEQTIAHIVVLASNELICSPCGACRQRIHEFSTKETRVHLCNKDTVFKSLTIDELLPLAFDF